MRRRTLVIAGSVAAALALLGTLAIVGLSERDSPASRPPLATPTTTAAESACGLPGTTGDEATGAIKSTWTDVAGWALPTSATDGPGVRTEKGPWSCYTRTPSGAVLAAYVIAMRGGGLADDWKLVIQEQTMPGPGRDVLLGSVPNFSNVTTPRGFAVAAYSPDRSTIRYGLSVNGGDYACTINVQWSDDDWRLVLGDDGSTSSGCTRGLPDEFTPWGP